MTIYMRIGEIICFALALFFLMPIPPSELGDSPYSARLAIISLSFFIMANIFNYCCDKSILNLVKSSIFVLIFGTFLLAYNIVITDI